MGVSVVRGPLLGEAHGLGRCDDLADLLPGIGGVVVGILGGVLLSSGGKAHPGEVEVAVIGEGLVVAPAGGAAAVNG